MTPIELHAEYWKRVGDRQQREISEPFTLGEQLIYSAQQKWHMRMIEREEFIKMLDADRRVQKGTTRLP